MHYWLKDSANGIFKAQIDFLKEQLSSQPQFREDKEKLLDLKKQGGCKAVMKSRIGRWSKSSLAKSKKASL